MPFFRWFWGLVLFCFLFGDDLGTLCLIIALIIIVLALTVIICGLWSLPFSCALKDLIF